MAIDTSYFRRLLLPGLFPLMALAQAPDGYYEAVDASSADALKASLHAIIDDHLRFPYTATATDTWDIINVADEDALNPANILDIYLNASYPKIPGGTGAYNREHSWPKSYGFPNDGVGNYPYTDAHHLFAADAGYNSSRSNSPFRDCDAACAEKVTLATNGRGGGSGVYPGNSNWTRGIAGQEAWQTWVGRKGDVARAMFYMAVRYEGGTHGVTGHAEPDLELTDDPALVAASNTGSNESVAYMGMLADLLRWHREDPIDAVETRRNDIVYGFQGNRNPFVDNPAWADCVFGADCGGGGGGGGEGGEPVVVLAGGEIPGYGIVTGDYTDTFFSDNIYQRLTEVDSGGKPRTRTSVAEHTWLFDLPAGRQAELTAELAFDAVGDDEGFVVEVSRDGLTFEPVFNVTPSSEDQLHRHLLQPGAGDTLMVRMRDGDRSAGARQPDAIRIDALRVTYYADDAVDTTPPLAPTGLAAAAGDGQVTLDWSDNGELDLAGYAVYRALQPDGPFDPVNAGLLTEPTYVDTTAVNGTRFVYVVTAVDMFGNESTPSNQVEATPQANPGAATFSVSTLNLSASGGRLVRVAAEVTLLDDTGLPVSGAVVTGSFEGALSETGQTVTDASGTATFRASDRLSRPVTVTFCVADAFREGLVYQPPAANCTTAGF